MNSIILPLVTSVLCATILAALIILCKISVINAVGSRRRQIATMNSDLRRMGEKLPNAFSNIVDATIPDNAQDERDFSELTFEYIESYYQIEVAKRDFSELSMFKSANKFLEYCDILQGQFHSLFHKCLIHDRLSLYIFRGPIANDDELLKAFHRSRDTALAAQGQTSQLSRPANA